MSQNAQGVRVEAAYGRPVMTSMHAFYSLGAILGSLAGGGFAWAGVALLSLAGRRRRGRRPHRRHRRPLAPPGRRPAPPPPARPRQTRWPAGRRAVDASLVAGSRHAGPRRRVRRLVLALGVLGICGLVGEGAAGDWRAVYLKDDLGTSAGFAALAFAAFSVTMTVGRAVGDGLIHRFAVVPVIRCCGLLATAGLTAALVSRTRASSSAGSRCSARGFPSSCPRSSRPAAAPTRRARDPASRRWSASATPAWRRARR